VSIRSLAVAVAAVLFGLPSLAWAGVRIAMAPISVHAAGSDSAYLSTGLREMLSARLDQYDGVRVIRLGAPDPAAAGREAAVEAGREAGADYVVFGSFTRFGEGASLDLSCVSLSQAPEADAMEEEVRRVFIHSGKLGEIIPQLDTLAEKIARYAQSGDGSGGGSSAAAAEVGEGTAADVKEESAEMEGLKRRVEALERAVYAPVASGAATGEETEEAESGGSAVR
jgi:TolB-like protein